MANNRDWLPHARTEQLHMVKVWHTVNDAKKPSGTSPRRPAGTARSL
ncbi:MAG: hypothetical protein LBQ88_01850 [Treponema sp.]|nr:hypothetical protein [Treponema sp.]